MPRLEACGPRGKAYKRFMHVMSEGKEKAFMLIDSEEPLSSSNDAWEHLFRHDGWEKPAGAEEDRVLFMATCMETWIVADRAALREHYGACLAENKLPTLEELESRPRGEVQEGLDAATKGCKAPYKKGKRSFELAEKLHPESLKDLSQFRRMLDILGKNL